MRALVLSLLLAAPAGADEAPGGPEGREGRPPSERDALAAAACGPEAPVLLLRPPRAGAPRRSSDEGPPDMLDAGEGCEERVASLPADWQVALRPEGPMTPEAVDRSFASAKRVDALATSLTQTRARLDAERAGGRGWLDQLFDRSAPRAGEAAGLRDALKTELSPPAAPDGNPVVRPAARAAVRRGPVVSAVPSPDTPHAPDWYDPALDPGQLSPLLRTSGEAPAHHHDGRGLWPFPSRVGPPAGATFPPNLNGTPATGPHQPLRAGDRNAPIWAPFYEKFKKCAREVMGNDSCEPYNFGIYRPSAMCHGVSRAIDVHAMKCEGVVHTALQNGRFAQVTLCMKRDGMKTIWQQCFINCRPFNVTSHHYDHAHFSIGCPAPFRW